MTDISEVQAELATNNDDIDDEKRELILELMDKTNAMSIGKAILEQIKHQTGAQLNISEQKREEMFDGLREMLIPVWDDTYTTEQLEGIVDFYNSDIGNVLLNKSPQVNEAVTKVGALWGRHVAMKHVDANSVQQPGNGPQGIITPSS